MKSEEGKILGVMGGMGPLATQLFYRMVIEKTDAHCDQEHINMILLNHATMPDRTGAILSGKLDSVGEKLQEDGRFLEAGGACVIAIPCNTSHFWIERLQNVLSVPIINMIRETANRAAEGGRGRRIAILATDGTIQTGLYQKECEQQGLIPVIPCEENQKAVMRIIYDGIKDGGSIDMDDFTKIEDELREKGCDCAIMACTELSCFKTMMDLPDFYLDAMEVLAEKAVLACGKALMLKKEIAR